jgi:hypothetical protein
MIKTTITEKMIDAETYETHKITRFLGIKVYERIFQSKSNELIDEYTPKTKNNVGFSKQ